jgi:hypothetical protein
MHRVELWYTWGLPEDGNSRNIRNLVFSSHLEFPMIDKAHKPNYSDLS